MTETSTLPGVFIARKKDGSIYFRSSITYRRKHISLGSFPTMKLAHTAYLEALNLLEDSSLSIDSYQKTHTLSFDKWIILNNFRDHNIYFGTPIYLKNRYFQYFYSKDCIYKFDMDDLFYYSSHKIMKRGGHLFVSDYGMQVNILNRYGIKNYGVEGRDYRFVNGDPTDLRYENIEIINTYQGVSSIMKDEKHFYRAKIHIQGDYIIGDYSTAIEAAVAYNKAIDILKKAGVQKNYTPNFIEELSPSAYADCYLKLHISKKIRNYTIS